MRQQGVTTKNIAIHIDLEAPIPTNPTWGKICKVCKQTICSQCDSKSTLPPGRLSSCISAGNYSLFNDILSKLNPDVIIAAVGKDSILKLFNNFGYQNIPSSCYNGLNLEYSKNSYIRPYQLNSKKILIWASNIKGSPFGGIPTNEEIKTMTAIKNHI